MTQPAATARIGGIVGTTVTTPDLAASVEAYTRDLGFVEVESGRLSAQQAAHWHAPAAAGAPYASLAPGGHRDFRFRFVEQPGATGYRAFTTHGWNAAELIVQDVDAMARSLEGSAFRIIGAPADLVFCTDIRAMQIVGPAGELLYLTGFKRPVPGLDVPEPRCPVDRVFIVILGGPSLPAMQAFYGERFGAPAAPVMESRVVAMADVFGLDREHRFRIAALPLAGQSLIEIDAMPEGARPVPRVDGLLPPGISIVSVSGPAADAGCVLGAAGELLEILPAATD
jgi:hypothetical protein